MKKIISIITILFFVLLSAGCGNTQTSSNGTNDATSIASSNTLQSEENNSTQSAGKNESPTNTEISIFDDKTGNKNDILSTEPVGTEKSESNKDNTENTLAPSPAEPTEAPEDNSIQSTMKLKKVGSLQYYLYTPNNPTSDMPLIVYLHGGTNKNADVASLLTTDGFPKYLYDGYYEDLRAYVAIPKLDNSYKGWADISDQIRDLIKSLNTNYAIDMNKISLTGHSMGGTGTYQLQVKLPNTFSCIAPMSGSIQNNQSNITALSKTKIWAFVGTDDTIVNPDSSRTIIKALNEKGANAKITELESATHFDVPSLAYKNDALIQWLVNCGE